MATSKYIIGELQFTEQLGDRDAIHMPVVVCTSNSKLHPGCKVKFVSRSVVKESDNEFHYHGIVDPFIDCDFARYEKAFLVFVRPDLTTPPRHEFKMSIPEAEKVDKEAEEAAEEAAVDEEFDECKWCN